MIRWTALHLHYHDDLDRLLTELVAPLVSELRRTEGLRHWFFLRYWDGGSHLRLRLGADTPDRSMIIADRARERATAYLRTRPSTRAVPDDEYRRLAAIFAAAEGTVASPAQVQDNTVLITDYRPEHDRYGNGATLAAVEDHFRVSSEIALRLVAGTGPAERLTAAFGFLLAGWRIAMPDPTRLGDFADLLCEAWRRRLGPRVAPERERAFAERYRQQRDRLHARACGEPDPLTALWTRSLQTVADVIRPEVETGAFRPAPRPGWADVIDDEDTDVAVLSVLDLCSHLICNRLGITTVHESYLRFVTTAVARDLAGTSASRPPLQEVR